MAKHEIPLPDNSDEIIAREEELRNQSIISLAVNLDLHEQQLRELHSLYRLNPWLMHISSEHFQIFSQLQEYLDPVNFGLNTAPARHPQTNIMRAIRIDSF